ncbi:MAG TPA: TIGR02996 domain-containing protein, partial [Gemmata sp.]|nr:TIGR02996 domain-containing protein [Gemmata sp.]
MTEEEAFVAAIVASPADDTPRLVFADWLEENGRPARAELIRLQCRLEPDRERFDDDAINVLHRRVNHLLCSSEPGRQAIEDQEQRWFQTASGRSWIDAPLTLHWRRGFVETVG